MLQSRFKLSSHRLETSPELQASLKEMEDLANTQPVTDWEMKLVGVVKDFATGYVHFSGSFQKVNPLPPWVIHLLFSETNFSPRPLWPEA